MARKSALERIDNHEKICRLMQKQTFDRIDRMEARIVRIEKERNDRKYKEVIIKYNINNI